MEIADRQIVDTKNYYFLTNNIFFIVEKNNVHLNQNYLVTTRFQQRLFNWIENLYR